MLGYATAGKPVCPGEGLTHQNSSVALANLSLNVLVTSADEIALPQLKSAVQHGAGSDAI